MAKCIGSVHRFRDAAMKPFRQVMTVNPMNKKRNLSANMERFLCTSLRRPRLGNGQDRLPAGRRLLHEQGQVLVLAALCQTVE